MSRRPRSDTPGSWHHVINRGIARRSVFENRSDIRIFLACVARSVRRGEIEVHAYCILTTHYHLLVRSPKRMLSEAMRRIQNYYVRRFNQTRRRDGPLFRGRFLSKRVGSLAYRRVLVRYIDANAVHAGIVADPIEYPYGSASAYGRLEGPRWLTRSWVESVVESESGRRYSRAGYASVFSCLRSEQTMAWIEQRTRHAGLDIDPLDDLVGSSPVGVRRWMTKKARLADGSRPGLPLCDPESVEAAIDDASKCFGSWLIHMSQKPTDAWIQMRVGLLAGASGLSAPSIAARVRRSEGNVGVLRRRHGAAMLADTSYGTRAAELLVDAMRRCGSR